MKYIHACVCIGIEIFKFIVFETIGGHHDTTQPQVSADSLGRVVPVSKCLIETTRDGVALASSNWS